ncbi:MAG: peroxide stress protein YaaA [Candidatus Bathyarchaeia archaeon]
MAEKTLILIPCCDSKTPGGTQTYDKDKCVVNYLSPDMGKKLMELRRRVAVAFKERLGPDTGVYQPETQIKYMKAYERYNGNLYSRITKSSWEKLNRSQNLSLLIISAFYGVVRHDESIRNYNRAMNKDKIEGKLLKTWWREHGLCSILLDYIVTNDVKVVHDFLSLNYSEAVWPLQNEAESIGVSYIIHEYSGLGSGSNYYRGEDVQKLIQSFDGK